MAQLVDWVPKTYEFFLPFALNMKKMASANQLVWKLVPTSVTDMGKEVGQFVAQKLKMKKQLATISNYFIGVIT